MRSAAAATTGALRRPGPRAHTGSLVVLALVSACVATPYAPPEPLPGETLVSIRLTARVDALPVANATGVAVHVYDAASRCPADGVPPRDSHRGYVTLHAGDPEPVILAIAGHHLLLRFYFERNTGVSMLRCDLEGWLVPEAGFAYEVSYSHVEARCQIDAIQIRGSSRQPATLTAACPEARDARE